MQVGEGDRTPRRRVPTIPGQPLQPPPPAAPGQAPLSRATVMSGPHSAAGQASTPRPWATGWGAVVSALVEQRPKDVDVGKPQEPRLSHPGCSHRPWGTSCPGGRGEAELGDTREPQALRLYSLLPARGLLTDPHEAGVPPPSKSCWTGFPSASFSCTPGSGRAQKNRP